MCVFCKIINNEIPCYKIYETENVLSFLDISQVTPGHTLVIPKAHCETIFELDKKLAEELFTSVIHVSKLLKEKLNVQDFNLLNNNGRLAGQEVNHYHIHIIPRYENDGCNFNKPGKGVDHQALAKIHEKIMG